MKGEYIIVLRFEDLTSRSTYLDLPFSDARHHSESSLRRYFINYLLCTPFIIPHTNSQIHQYLRSFNPLSVHVYFHLFTRQPFIHLFVHSSSFRSSTYPFVNLLSISSSNRQPTTIRQPLGRHITSGSSTTYLVIHLFVCRPAPNVNYFKSFTHLSVHSST